MTSTGLTIYYSWSDRHAAHSSLSTDLEKYHKLVKHLEYVFQGKIFVALKKFITLGVQRWGEDSNSLNVNVYRIASIAPGGVVHSSVTLGKLTHLYRCVIHELFEKSELLTAYKSLCL